MIDNTLTEKLHYIFKYSVEHGILPILWINEEGKIIYYNKAVEEYSGESNLENSYIYRISSDIKKEQWDILWNKIKENETYKFIHEFYNKKLDTIFTFSVLSNKVKYEDSYYCHMVVVDVTELIETNLRLSKEKLKAEESEKLKNAFLSNMSHEIRTPMNAIVGFSEILNNSVEDIYKEYTKIIVENVDYLLSLIDNIIMISRIDSEQIKVKYNTFDLLDLINDLWVNYSFKLKKSNKKFNIIVDNVGSQIIESDKYIIEECLQRLVDNAIKFSIEGNIHIGFYTQDKSITIYVKDNGIGIENKLQEIIFDRFRQVDKQTVGSGLGLSIFKSFINILGGKYNITSKLNEGTLISFTLNIKSDIIKKVDTFILDINETNRLKGKRILVAEDLEVNQLLINDMLIPYNVSIIKCMDGRECIDKFSEIKDIDLVLMDLDMPHLDGYETTKIIREVDKVIPIIAQTAYSQKENRERARRIGFTDFLTKPFTKDKLLKIILKHL
jgi:signal transduction histidine kinase/CheY-like chemotaxis protein